MRFDSNYLLVAICTAAALAAVGWFFGDLLFETAAPSTTYLNLR